MNEDFITVPRKEWDDLHERVAKLEELATERAVDPVRVAFHRFNAQAREHEARRAGQ